MFSFANDSRTNAESRAGLPRFYRGGSVTDSELIEFAASFREGGSTDLELRFEFGKEQETAIAEELKAKGRATPTFEYAYYLTDGSLCTLIRNTVAIRPKGYRKATTPPAALDGL